MLRYRVSFQHGLMQQSSRRAREGIWKQNSEVIFSWSDELVLESSILNQPVFTRNKELEILQGKAGKTKTAKTVSFCRYQNKYFLLSDSQSIVLYVQDNVHRNILHLVIDYFIV